MIYSKGWYFFCLSFIFSFVRSIRLCLSGSLVAASSLQTFFYIGTVIGIEVFVSGSSFNIVIFVCMDVFDVLVVVDVVAK